MNFNDLQEACWRFLGQHDTGNRVDWQRQEVRDAINNTQLELHSAFPWLWQSVRESTLSLVNGTATYALNDWCLRPLAFWTEGTAAHKVMFRQPRIADRDGSRNTSQSFGSLGPYELCWTPRSTTAAVSGTAGATTEGSATITKTAGTDWASAHVGRMLRLKGESEDYSISAVASATSLTADRVFRGRITGLGTTGVSANYSAVKWEIGPPGRFQVKFLPAPTTSVTVYYRYIALPRRLVNADETPELPEEHHDLLWKGGLRMLSALKEDDASWQRFTAEYGAGVELLERRNIDDIDSEDAPHFETTLNNDAYQGLPNDAHFRDRRWY